MTEKKNSSTPTIGQTRPRWWSVLVTGRCPAGRGCYCGCGCWANLGLVGDKSGLTRKGPGEGVGTCAHRVRRTATGFNVKHIVRIALLKKVWRPSTLRPVPRRYPEQLWLSPHLFRHAADANTNFRRIGPEVRYAPPPVSRAPMTGLDVEGGASLDSVGTDSCPPVAWPRTSPSPRVRTFVAVGT